MPKIYSAAELVVVWLGEDADDSQQAINLIRLATQIFPLLPDGTGTADATLAAYELPTRGSGPWISVSKLLQRPWFQRLWTLQEIVLAKRASIWCGRHGIDWQELEVLMAYLYRLSALDLLLNIMPPNGQTLCDGIFQVPVIKDRIIRGEQEAPDHLYNVFVQGLSRKATYPEDCVHGILGLLSENTRTHIPAYSWSSHVVQYTEIAAWFLQFDPALTLLHLTDNLGRPAEIPSWCPNFHSDLRNLSLHAYTNFNFNAGFRSRSDRLLPRDAKLRAGIDAISAVARIEETHFIRVSGLRLDRVQRVIPAISHPAYDSNAIAQPRDIHLNPSLLP